MQTHALTRIVLTANQIKMRGRECRRPYRTKICYLYFKSFHCLLRNYYILIAYYTIESDLIGWKRRNAGFHEVIWGEMFITLPHCVHPFAVHFTILSAIQPSVAALITPSVHRPQNKPTAATRSEVTEPISASVMMLPTINSSWCLIIVHLHPFPKTIIV